jgi:tetratricopeptide (TPR) repeat protein
LSLAQNKQDLNLARKYYQDGDCEKAIVTYKKLSQSNININSYYSNYLQCLIKLEQYREAEALVKKLQKKHSHNPQYLVDLGYVKQEKGQGSQAKKYFQQAIDKLQSGKVHLVNNVANSFLRIQASEWALKAYEVGMELNPQHDFGFQLANTYKNLGKTEEMIDCFLAIVKRNPKSRKNVQNNLQNTLGRTAGVDDNYDLLKKKLLLEVQKSNDLELTKMLVWLFMQTNQFEAAFIYAKSLDKRLQEDGRRLYELGQIALENELYPTAIKCYDYLLQKGSNNPYHLDAKKAHISTQAKQLLTGNYSSLALQKVNTLFSQGIAELGKSYATASLLKEYAYFLSFHQKDISTAITLLEECIRLSQQDKVLQAQCKMDLGDLQLIQGESWEAILLYAQVEKDFKENPLGHEAKFRRARISYFQGEFDWAQAQLDVLKASTSKLIANNAMRISLLITDNTGLDTSEAAMQLYARAELLSFQQRYTESLACLDSLNDIYKGHSLADEVIYQKGMIYLQTHQYRLAVEQFKEVQQSYGYDVLADDALFQWAYISEKHLQNKEAAIGLYEQLINDYSSSIHTAEARKNYRRLIAETATK